MKAVLLDRDGVINALVYHQNAGVIDSPFTASQFKLLPRVPAAIRHFNKLGLKVAIVSNQPGIAKGHLRYETLKRFEKAMVSGIGSGGGYRLRWTCAASIAGNASAACALAIIIGSKIEV